MSTAEFTQPDRRFRGHAYRYLRPADRLPTWAQISGPNEKPDPIVHVRLFLPGSLWTFFVCGADVEENGMSGREDILALGHVISPAGPGYDEWGTSWMSEIGAVRDQLGLAVERDLHFTRSPLSAALADHHGVPVGA